MKICKQPGCNYPAEPSLKYCRGHEGGFSAPFVGKTEAESKPQPAWTDIVEPSELSVAYLWTLYAGAVIPPGAPVIQRDEMRNAFYAGFTECFKLFNDISTKLPEKQAYEVLQRLNDEAAEFFKKMMREHGTE